MNIKVIIYMFSTLIVAFALDSVNINAIFKKNKIYQARLLYFLIAIIMIYLLTNFIYDFGTIIQIL